MQIRKYSPLLLYSLIFEDHTVSLDAFHLNIGIPVAPAHGTNRVNRRVYTHTHTQTRLLPKLNSAH